MAGELPDAQIVIQDGGLGVRGPLATGVFAAVGAAPNKAASVRYGEVLSLSNPRKAHELLGAGPLRDLVVSALSIAGTVCHAVPLDKTAAAGKAVTERTTGNNANTLSVAGSDAAAGRIVEAKVTKAGVLGTAEVTISVDGVAGEAQVLTLKAGTKAEPIEAGGMTLTFDAKNTAFVLDDVWVARGARYAAPAKADMLAAVDTLIASSHLFEWVSVAGETTHDLWAALAVKAAAALTRHRHVHFKAQGKYPYSTTTAAAWAADAAGAQVRGVTTDTRLQVYASWVRYADPITGKTEVRPLADLGAGLSARRRAHEPVDAVRYGAIPGVTGLYPHDTDDAAVTVVDAAGYAAARTYAGRRGVYLARSRMLAPAGSDFRTEERRRVMDRACTLVRAAQMNYLNSDLRLSPDGTLAGITLFRSISQQPLDQMAQQGAISAGRVEIDPLQDILSTETVESEIAIVPLGKLTNIRTTLSYANPVLDRIAAGQAPAEPAAPDAS